MTAIYLTENVIIHQVNIIYQAFCTLMSISRQNEARSRDYNYLILSNDFKGHLSGHYHIHHCTLHAFVQFRALYMDNLDDKHSTQPGFEFPATTGSIEPSGLANIIHETNRALSFHLIYYTSVIYRIN